VGSVRHLHKGHVGATLEKLDLPRMPWLKEVDQAPEKSAIRMKKDQHMRELGLLHKDVQGLFREDSSLKQAIEKVDDEQLSKDAQSSQRRESVNEALRMYRLLRPDAHPFYEEDAMLTMKAKMNKVLLDESRAETEAKGGHSVVPRGDKYADPFKAYLPVVNQRAFLLALESVVASLADDIETMCLVVGLEKDSLPTEGDPLRFHKLLNLLFGAFPLKKDPSHVDEWMRVHWPRVRLLLPMEVAELPEEAVGAWLRGHLSRVRTNQRRSRAKIYLHLAERFGGEEFYSLAEDFPYDDDPVPGALADERNLDFPLEQAAAYMRSLLGLLGRSPAAAEWGPGGGAEVAASPAEEVSEQFQDLVWDLEKIGLRSWVKMDIRELEKALPKGRISELAPPGCPAPEGSIPLSQDDVAVAGLMLRCAARGRGDLLEFEAVDPHRLLHGLPARDIEEELAGLPATCPVGDAELGGLVEAHEARLRRLREPGRGALSEAEESRNDAWLSEGASVEDVYKRELDFYRTAGPVEWEEKDDEFKWKWRQPPNTFFDERRKVYIQEQKGVNPNLELKELRQHLLELKRCTSMVKVGRVSYYRAVVLVGNGKGVYGFGVGFGNNAKESRADAALRALQNLDYLDLDPGRMQCFPVRGKEYKHEAKIFPRPIGRGVKANKRFMPVVYILGLDNCKVKFSGHKKWFTRVRALKRALDDLMSRRTLANMTGKRYSLLVAPGDHWVHWPDRWFENIRQPYDQKAAHVKLMRQHALRFKKRGNTTATQLEVKSGWRKERWARWANPLERWLQYRRLVQPYDPGKQAGEGEGEGEQGEGEDRARGEDAGGTRPHARRAPRHHQSCPPPGFQHRAISASIKIGSSSASGKCDRSEFRLWLDNCMRSSAPAGETVVAALPRLRSHLPKRTHRGPC